MNCVLVAPAGTITVLGTVTAESLLDRFTESPLPGAAALRITVQLSAPVPVTDPLLQDSRLNGGGIPVPLRLITVVALVDELLVTAI